jgi:hypothetical protein
MALGYTVFTGALKTLEPHTQRRIDPGARAEKTDLICATHSSLLLLLDPLPVNRHRGGFRGEPGGTHPGHLRAHTAQCSKPMRLLPEY